MTHPRLFSVLNSSPPPQTEATLIENTTERDWSGLQRIIRLPRKAYRFLLLAKGYTGQILRFKASWCRSGLGVLTAAEGVRLKIKLNSYL